MLIKVYDKNPNPRSIRQIGDILRNGGIAIIPTDSLYAFACSMQHKKAAETMARLKDYSLKSAKYSLLCSSVSQMSQYVRAIDNSTFSLLKNYLPGPFTFILNAASTTPRHYQNANHSIGIRVPDNAIAQAIIDEVGCPLVVTSVRSSSPDTDEYDFSNPEVIHDIYGSKVDIVVDGGFCDLEPSTVVDITDGMEIIRQGKGIFEQ